MALERGVTLKREGEVQSRTNRDSNLLGRSQEGTENYWIQGSAMKRVRGIGKGNVRGEEEFVFQESNRETQGEGICLRNSLQGWQD